MSYVPNRKLEPLTDTELNDIDSYIHLCVVVSATNAVADYLAKAKLRMLQDKEKLRLHGSKDLKIGEQCLCCGAKFDPMSGCMCH